MNSNVYSKLASRLSTMSGYPGWSDLMSENYFADLNAVPDEVGWKMIPEVQKRFDERPSVKNLLDWARSLGPQKPFDIRALDGPKAAAYRPGGMSAPGIAALAGAQTAGRAAMTEGKMPIPESARAIIRQLQARDKADRHRGHAGPVATGDFGLEYTLGDGRIERYPAIHSEEEARRRQAEVCRKYSHFQCRIYQKQKGELMT